MAQVKFDTTSLLKSMAPGLPAFVVDHFKDHIEAEMNKAITEAHKKALETLPKHVETALMNIMDPSWGTDKVQVMIDLRDSRKEQFTHAK